ncbi:class I SAM-dependent methyltransferase [Candidatus Woesearchaeota archaeon]|nr:class I SAM-dependent methyltransferase [Candidatus Woesearchaeota archaeon]
MDLEDYLKREGISNDQRELVDIISTSHPSAQERFCSLSDSYVAVNIPENISAFYDLIAEMGLYNALLSRFYASINQTMPHFLKHITGDSVLDVGCGNGVKTIFYAQHNPDKTFIGVDISHRSLQDAHSRKQRYGLRNVHFIQQDMTTLCFARQFDTIIADKVLHETQRLSGYCYGEWGYEPQFVEHLTVLSNHLAGHGKILVTLTPCSLDWFLGHFDFLVDSAGLRVEDVLLVDYDRAQQSTTDIVYTITK